MEKMKIAAVITAGGMGLRLPGEVKKQFRLLAGKPLLIRAIEPFAGIGEIEEIVIALPEQEIDSFQSVCSDYFSDQIMAQMKFCTGGQLRQDSVFKALKLCAPDAKLAIVHDGVRPFVTKKLINDLINLTKEYGAAIPGAPVKNTIKTIKEDIVDHTIRRDILLQVYTPQVFDYNILMKCYHRAMT
ncbi:MAG: 2-C-methyl-D-erythritol 4-phosphate cytidylyltransferase, partial [Candidatus Cloacimonadaceae bacterium]